MFVRWKKRMRKDGKNYMLIASLVENKRIDGKPVQKHLLHLGSYSTLQHSSWANYDWKATSFWMRAVEVLNAKGIDLIRQEFIYSQLHERAPLPTPEAIQQYRKNNSYVPDWMNKYEQWYEYNAWRFL